MQHDLRIYYLITTHNHEQFIGAALQSLFAAHENWFNSPLAKQARILILDDASSDQTWNKLRDYQAAQNHAVTLARNPTNTALIGLNRNRLLERLFQLNPSEQDLVMFLDGDDLLPANHLRDRLQVFESDPTLDCVGGQLELFYDNGQQPQLIDTFSTDCETAEIANLFECHYYISNTLFKARVLRRPRFCEISSSEDWLFFATNQMRRQHCAQATLQYRRHSSNLTSLNQLSSLHPTPVSQYQTAARAFGLARMGFKPSTEDHQLLAQIGYHSFRIRFVGQQYLPAPTIAMPWFNWISTQNDCRRDSAQLSARIENMFDRMSVANAQTGHFNPDKLGHFLEAMQRSIATELDYASNLDAIAR